MVGLDPATRGYRLNFCSGQCPPHLAGSPGMPPPSIPLSSASSRPTTLGPWVLPAVSLLEGLSLSSTLTVMATWSRQMCRIWW